jgi:uncharacterized RDD family membrane protein YckC
MSTGQTIHVASSYSADRPVVIGEGVALELRPAGIGSRGLALLIDVVIQTGVTIILFFIAAAAALHMNGAAATAIILSMYVSLLVGYPVGFETLAHGRTPGKMALGLRVVRDDGGPIRFRHAFSRGLVGVIVDRPGFSLALLAFIPMLVSSRSKRLGDFVAGTMVLQERVPTRSSSPPGMPPELAAWAMQLDLAGVTDELALQVRQFLVRAPQLSPWARDDLCARFVADVARRTGAAPVPGTPGWAYLSAVLAERRRRELDRARPAEGDRPSTATLPVHAPRAQPPAAPPTTDGPFAPPG